MLTNDRAKSVTSADAVDKKIRLHLLLRSVVIITAVHFSATMWLPGYYQFVAQWRQLHYAIGLWYCFLSIAVPLYLAIRMVLVREQREFTALFVDLMTVVAWWCLFGGVLFYTASTNFIGI